jgi:hypothetical protein
MTVSTRSYLAAGLAAATLSAVAVVPVTMPAISSVNLASIQLSAAALPLIQPADAGSMLGVAATESPESAVTAAANPVAAATGSTGDMIINAYNALQPWVQWGFELGAWAVSYLPWPLGWLGQQVNIAYDTGQPIVQALVYSFAFLIDGQIDLIGPILVNGVNTAVTNLVEGEIAWVLGFFPPLPPVPVFPVFPTAAVAARAAAVTPAARSRQAAAPDSGPVTDTAASTEAASGAPEPVESTTQPSDVALPAAVETPLSQRGVGRGALRVRQPKPEFSTLGTERAPATAVSAQPATAVSAQPATAVSAQPATAAAVKAPDRPVREAARAARSGMDG